MRVNRLDLNQLACLDALLRERNVSRAAERVFLSQSATSWVLARLREYFGDRLLIQSGRSMVLTPFAQGLQGPLHDWLLQAQALTQRRPAVDLRQIERRLTLVASDYVAAILLAKAFSYAQNEAPGIQFDVRPVSEYLDGMLDAGDVEMLVGSHLAISGTHPHEIIMKDTFVAAASADHPDLGRKLSLEQYQRLGHVAVQWGAGRITTSDQSAKLKSGRQFRNEVVVGSFNLVPMFLVGTRRIGTLQRLLALQLAGQWPLKLLELPMKVDPLLIAAQWHRHLDEDPVIVWFRGLLHRVAAGLSKNRGPQLRR